MCIPTTPSAQRGAQGEGGEREKAKKAEEALALAKRKEEAETILEYWVDVTSWKKEDHKLEELKAKAKEIEDYTKDMDTKYKTEYVTAVLAPFSSLKK